MRTLDDKATPAALRTLDTNEIGSVSGGILPIAYNPAGMPDRMVGGCGTMWLLSRILGTFGTRR